MGGKLTGFAPGTRLSFEGERFAMDTFDMKGTFTVDLTKNPHHLDMEVPFDTSKDVFEGIFVLEHNVLRWCFAPMGKNNRPKEFATSENKDHMLVVLKRAKQ
jgi:uncharacterized protein (TIGR03067 family)